MTNSVARTLTDESHFARSSCREPSWLRPNQYSERDHQHIHVKLSNWLMAEIRDDHDLLCENIEAFDPTASTENYRLFLKFQFQLCEHLAPLYADPVILQKSLGLPQLGRTMHISLDLSDLGVREIPSSLANISLPGGLIQRLGWIFVAESMLLNSAKLFPAALRLNINAKHGARYLAQLAEEQKHRWEVFASVLDNFRMSEIETERLYSGARSALTFAQKQMTATFEAHTSLRIERKK